MVCHSDINAPEVQEKLRQLIRLAKEQDYLTFDDMNEAWDVWVDQANPPARATVEAKLASPDYLVEIAVIAAR